MLFSKQLPVISSIEYKQVVRKVRLSELLTNAMAMTMLNDADGKKAGLKLKV